MIPQFFVYLNCMGLQESVNFPHEAKVVAPWGWNRTEPFDLKSNALTFQPRRFAYCKTLIHHREARKSSFSICNHPSGKYHLIGVLLISSGAHESATYPPTQASDTEN